MNSYAIEFSTLHEYDTLKTGITIPVTLGYDSLTIDFEAKLDTGSSHCIFERRFGENLGLEIENGTPGKIRHGDRRVLRLRTRIDTFDFRY